MQTNKEKIAIETHIFLSHHDELLKAMSCSIFGAYTIALST
jgi:hypothetical protein